MSDPVIHDVSDTALFVAHYRAVEGTRPDALFHDPLLVLRFVLRGLFMTREQRAAARRFMGFALMEPFQKQEGRGTDSRAPRLRDSVPPPDPVT
jgi:O-methyltransferase involved in polyketide biosynthesis